MHVIRIKALGNDEVTSSVLNCLEIIRFYGATLIEHYERNDLRFIASELFDVATQLENEIEKVSYILIMI